MGKSLVSERVVLAVSMLESIVKAVGFGEGFIGSGHHHFRKSGRYNVGGYFACSAFVSFKHLDEFLGAVTTIGKVRKN